MLNKKTLSQKKKERKKERRTEGRSVDGGLPQEMKYQVNVNKSKQV
jgi:hypothetical protein